MPVLHQITVSALGDSDDKINNLVSQLNEWARIISVESHAADIDQGSLVLKDNQLLLTKPDNTQIIIVGRDDNDEFNAITADSIEAGTITATEIASGTITTGLIASGAITTGLLASDAVTAEKIAADTITGDNISALDLTGKTLTADTGTVGGWTLGTTEIVGPDGAVFRSGQTDFNTGTGFWLGNRDSTPKFSIGQSGGNSMVWDGENLRITGALTPTTIFNTISYATADLPVPPTTEGFNDPGDSE